MYGFIHLSVEKEFFCCIFRYLTTSLFSRTRKNFNMAPFRWSKVFFFHYLKLDDFTKIQRAERIHGRVNVAGKTSRMWNLNFRFLLSFHILSTFARFSSYPLFIFGWGFISQFTPKVFDKYIETFRGCALLFWLHQDVALRYITFVIKHSCSKTEKRTLPPPPHRHPPIITLIIHPRLDAKYSVFQGRQIKRLTTFLWKKVLRVFFFNLQTWSTLQIGILQKLLERSWSC